VRESGKSVAVVAGELDLTETALRSWVRQGEIGASRGTPGALTIEGREELAAEKAVSSVRMLCARRRRRFRVTTTHATRCRSYATSWPVRAAVPDEACQGRSELSRKHRSKMSPVHRGSCRPGHASTPTSSGSSASLGLRPSNPAFFFSRSR
jgi:hypothetical protein